MSFSLKIDLQASRQRRTAPRSTASAASSASAAASPPPSPPTCPAQLAPRRRRVGLVRHARGLPPPCAAVPSPGDEFVRGASPRRRLRGPRGGASLRRRHHGRWRHSATRGSAASFPDDDRRLFFRLLGIPSQSCMAPQPTCHRSLSPSGSCTAGAKVHRCRATLPPLPAWWRSVQSWAAAVVPGGAYGAYSWRARRSSGEAGGVCWKSKWFVNKNQVVCL
ncbi:hypothetical protein PAHAL_7G043700 [Panicum hallii]|jgi:hypothetical protein|uniref:Uncharacterized protein n=1 Tax=Panicum hallii TaxID=206008 RepID=A0A2T8IAY6_9POAL|nr:hypothetical protein PAHAL_7G043700 [Panicum hallii]